MIEAVQGYVHARSSLMREADRLERLATDLRAIAAGSSPRPEELETAAVLDSWVFSSRSMVTLLGTVVGHPRLPDGPAHTTEVWAIDPERRWARTLSRYYALGTPATGGQHVH